MRTALIVSILLALLGMSGCETDSARVADHELAVAFADVLDLYNARLDLTAQALALARGHLPSDAPVLATLASSRAAVAELHASPALLDSPASFERFDVAQRELTDSISQLLIACEAVPRLSANPKFRALQARLASSAGRIAVARERYDEAARRYNASRQRFALHLADVMHAQRDRPVFTVPDTTPVHRQPRTDFGALRGSLRV
ncbi:LemA family protein [Paraburkholderia sp. MMS20-SJTN17]|uniref:LemA family protein n=1 Tax=Paraburkholderia translucens TaxID=2886945 RepID=A0ABS8KJB0_9BURK|nr:LemA family protein [Paraburkholderia sp. MMS20-SJTN17]MCC8404868.1 LemA family protein [Paraburkholderia sp. MMS20-SJTN17]